MFTVFPLRFRVANKQVRRRKSMRSSYFHLTNNKWHINTSTSFSRYCIFIVETCIISFVMLNHSNKKLKDRSRSLRLRSNRAQKGRNNAFEKKRKSKKC